MNEEKKYIDNIANQMADNLSKVIHPPYVTTPRIEDMVEDCLPKSSDLEKVGGHYWGGDYEPTYYELINLEASFREILKPKLKQALTEAYQAGIDEANEKLENAPIEKLTVENDKLYATIIVPKEDFEIYTKALQDNK